MPEFLYCKNASCSAKTDCIRYVDKDIPLDNWEQEKGLNHHLFPFHTEIQKNPFSPDKSGRCGSFIESPNSRRLKSEKF